MSSPDVVTPPIDQVVREVDQSQHRVEAVVRLMHDAEVGAASALPGWTRGHVLTHLARNADSQTRMLVGAQRGETLDQYPGGDEQRSGDIEAGAGRPLSEIATDLADGHRRFIEAADAMTDDGWAHLTRPRAGERPAWSTVWARWREVEVHLVDLGLGPESPASRPTAAFVAAFLPGELGGLPRRLPDGRRSSGVGGIQLEGDDTDRLLWLMGRRSGPVRLTVDGVAVSADELAPWPRSMWAPGVD